MNESRLCPSCQQLLILSQDLFELAAYDAAYQTLVTALECAKDRETIKSLLDVCDTAEGRLVFIDAHQPDRPPATQRARGQNPPYLLKVLARRARLQAEILHAKIAKFQPL